MRTILASIVLTLSVASAGCASSSGGSAGYSPSSKTTKYVYRQDTDYINTVERTAARRGVAVEWVNPPWVREREVKAPPARPRDGD